MILNILLGIHVLFSLFGLVNWFYYSSTVGPFFSMTSTAKLGFISLLILVYRIWG